MPLFDPPRNRFSPPRRSPQLRFVRNGGRCPQPCCQHPSHHGIPVQTRYHGTSRAQGRVIHHVRCSVNPDHHLCFTRNGDGWYQVASR